MKIYRSILLDKGDKIETDNIGVSWTICPEFVVFHAEDINRCVGRDGYVVLSMDIQKDNVDWSNTLDAMENREHEFELVINAYSNIKCEIEVVKNLDFAVGTIIEGNAGGNTFEDYNEEYDGGLTINDFMEGLSW